MKHIYKLTLLMTIGCTGFMQAQPCVSDSFESVETLDTEEGPLAVAYSPLVGSNLYVAVTDVEANIEMYSENIITGTLTFLGNTGTGGVFSGDVAFSPIFNGNLYVATSNVNTDNVSVFQVDTTTGALTMVGALPVDVGTEPSAITYSPVASNNLFVAVTNFADRTVVVFQADPVTGALTSTSLSPFNTGAGPSDVAFSPIINSNLFVAVANQTDNTISVYQVDQTTGNLNNVGTYGTGGGVNPVGIAFSPVLSGNILFAAAVNFVSNNVSVYSVDPTTGVFTQVQITTALGSEPSAIAFSPLIGGNLYAVVSNENSGTINVYQVDTTSGQFTSIQTLFPDDDLIDIALSPIVPGGLFMSVPGNEGSQLFVYQLVQAITPTINTPSSAIRCPSPITISASIDGGVPPYTVVWSDGLTQTISGTTTSRVVIPQVTTQYQITVVTDSDDCSGGPSNAITITVIGGPCCN